MTFAHVLGLISHDDDSHYRKEINSFVEYCDSHFLELSVKTAKKLVINFRRNKGTSSAVETKWTIIERTNTYKYLGVVFNDKLTWSDHVSSLLVKLSPCLYCMRKLQFFNVSSEVMKMFALSVIYSVSYFLVGRGGNVGVTEKNRIDKLNKRAGNMAGLTITLDSVNYKRLEKMT